MIDLFQKILFGWSWIHDLSQFYQHIFLFKKKNKGWDTQASMYWIHIKYQYFSKIEYLRFLTVFDNSISKKNDRFEFWIFLLERYQKNVTWAVKLLMEPSDLVVLFNFLHEEILDSHPPPLLEGRKKKMSYSLYFPSSTSPSSFIVFPKYPLQTTC